MGPLKREQWVRWWSGVCEYVCLTLTLNVSVSVCLALCLAGSAPGAIQ